MKRIFAIILTALMLSVSLISASAEEGKVIRFDDGSYLVITVEADKGFARASQKVTGSTYYNYYSSGGTTEWKATMRATFTYTGSSATCTSVDNLSVNIYDSGWSLVSKSTRRSGNTAYGDVVMERSIIGGTQGVPVTLTLSCDRNGNLS